MGVRVTKARRPTDASVLPFSPAGTVTYVGVGIGARAVSMVTDGNAHAIPDTLMKPVLRVRNQNALVT